VSALELPSFGPIPAIEKKWKLREQGKSDASIFAWNWIVFTNSENGDVLSFAAHRFAPGERRELIYLSDTAHESFVDGFPMWSRGESAAASMESVSMESIRNRVVKLDLMNSAARKDLSQEALEFSFVREVAHGTNLMAHGYALVFEDGAVLVQHLSARPMASAFANGLAVSLLSSNFRKSASAKPQPPVRR